MFLYLKIINEIETFVFESNAPGKKTNLIERIFFVLEFFLFVFIFARKRPNVSK